MSVLNKIKNSAESLRDKKLSYKKDTLDEKYHAIIINENTSRFLLLISFSWEGNQIRAATNANSINTISVVSLAIYRCF
jgi:hypothetical protein